jgi:outer membrane protein W
MEHHFNISKRLSPYIGFIGELAYTHFYSESIYPEFSISGARTTNRYTIGAAAVGGLDYYFAKKVYLGLEMSYNISYTYSRTNIEDITNGELVSSSREQTVGSRLSILRYIRIGFIF